MKKVTQIRFIGGNKYELFIENIKYIFYADTLVKNNLLKPRDLSETEIIEIVDYNNYLLGYEKALKFISYKKRTEKEVKEKLKSLGISEKISNKTILKLKENNYLNKDDYLKSFINDRVKLSLKGPYKIKNELLTLGFNENEINKYLNNINNEVWINKINEIINKRIKSNRSLSKKMFLYQLSNYLFNEGYDKNIYDSIVSKIHVDESEIYQNEYNKLFKKYKNKYPKEILDIKIKDKLIKLGFDI
ncbi:MAG: hypothetical protein GX951_01090 [Mollicutes bacterium]|nr:hypothetical protein [Mollicutes bacterium]